MLTILNVFKRIHEYSENIILSLVRANPYEPLPSKYINSNGQRGTAQQLKAIGESKKTIKTLLDGIFHIETCPDMNPRMDKSTSTNPLEFKQ